MISHLDHFSCHYGNYRRLEAQKKWDVTLRKRREIRGIKPEKRLLNMTTGYPGVYVDLIREGCDPEMIACVEYDSHDGRMLTTVYDIGHDEPTVIHHYDLDEEEEA